MIINFCRIELSGFDGSIRRRRTEKVRKNLETLEPLAIVKMGVGKKILGVKERSSRLTERSKLTERSRLTERRGSTTLCSFSSTRSNQAR